MTHELLPPFRREIALQDDGVRRAALRERPPDRIAVIVPTSTLRTLGEGEIIRTKEKDRGSVEQSLEFFTQAVDDADLGGVNGADGYAKLGGHVSRRPARDHHLPACFPSGFLEIGSHDP